MIRILGCFKVVPDLTQLAEEDWVPDEDNRIDTSFIKTVWNCFDESALEMMLRFSDHSEDPGIQVQLDAVTIGGSVCDNYLKTLYALGFERAVRIECEEEIRFWPELTAGLITEYVSRKGGQDVIVMGRQSADGENGKTPLLTAEQLGWPCITQVLSVEPVDEEYVRVVSRVDGGIVTRKIRIPCVLSVGDAPSAYLRVPTLKERMKRGKRPIEQYSMAELHVKKDFVDLAPGAELLEISAVNKERKGKLLEGEDIREKVHTLYQSYMKGRLKEL